jgi:NAD(P)-dependent dehydrogenase (short-subunit alcohol dehydrogenase family)
MSQQKVWFITGSSRGFGRAWTEAVRKRGDKVRPRLKLAPDHSQNLCGPP